MAQFKFDIFIADWFELNQDKRLIFDWDDGNSTKNLEKHDITTEEIEEVFIDERLMLLGKQYQPQKEEDRYGCIGSAFEKLIFISFTLRQGKIRPISARKANKKEKEIYNEEDK